MTYNVANTILKVVGRSKFVKFYLLIDSWDSFYSVLRLNIV